MSSERSFMPLGLSLANFESAQDIDRASSPCLYAPTIHSKGEQYPRVRVLRSRPGQPHCLLRTNHEPTHNVHGQIFLHCSVKQSEDHMEVVKSFDFPRRDKGACVEAGKHDRILWGSPMHRPGSLHMQGTAGASARHRRSSGR
jgi:hypothetical protein